MEQIFQLEEHNGYKFYVEHVAAITDCDWFRVHMSNGSVHNMTIGYAESIGRAKEEVIDSFKKFLDGGILNGGTL